MAGGGVSYVVYTSDLVRRAPVLEDVPYDAVVAEPREEVEDGVVRRQLAALGEAADGEDVSMWGSHVLLVRTVFADAVDEAFGRESVLVFRQVHVIFGFVHDILGRVVALRRLPP